MAIRMMKPYRPWQFWAVTPKNVMTMRQQIRLRRRCDFTYPPSFLETHACYPHYSTISNNIISCSHQQHPLQQPPQLQQLNNNSHLIGEDDAGGGGTTEIVLI